MNSSNNQPTCPICGDIIGSSPKSTESNFRVKYCECNRCGRFTYDELSLESTHFKDVRHLVSAWVRRQVDAGVEFPAVPPADIIGFDAVDNWFDNLKYAGFPQTVTEKLDALLQAYAGIVKDEIGKVIKPHQHPHLISEIAAKNAEEIYSLNKLLHQLKDINLIVDITDTVSVDNVSIKADGWKRIDLMQKSIKSSDSAFIAMWYHSSMQNYRDSAIAAVKRCGYKPLIIDLHEFNDFIMDKAVAMIRESRFLIADLTCKPEIKEGGEKVKQGVRGGVYWEAGMAYGMGKTVIQTCKDNKDCKRRIHFDLEQYNTIFWKDDELSTSIRDITGLLPDPNFAEKLAQRILATIGKGTYQTGESDKKKLPE